MGGIDEVEEILPKRAPDEAAPAVVELDRNERRQREAEVVEDKDGEDAKQLVTAQPVEQENEDIAVHAVVRFEEIRGQAKPEQTEQGEQRLFTEAGEGAQPEIAKQQGEEHVLFFIPRRAGVHQIKGHLRDHRQRREAYPVAELIARVKKALDQQKAEDREGEPAEVAHQAVERQLMTPEPEEDELLIDF